jgi:hypothetical protein
LQDYVDWSSTVNHAGNTDITSSPVKGDTSFTIANWPVGVPQVNDLSQISVMNQYDANAGEVGDSALVVSTSGWEYTSRQVVRITNVTGSGATRTVYFTPALMMDLPSSLSPKIASTADAMGGTIDTAEGVGVECIAFFNHDSSSAYGGVGMNQSYGCWQYGVSSHASANYCGSFGMALKCEIRRGWYTHRQGVGSNGASIVFQSASSCLIADSVFGETNDPAWELFGYNSGNVFAYNYAPTASSPNNNHNPHEHHHTFEGNVTTYMLSDGYFGGDSENTVLRNYFFGHRYASPEGGALQFAIAGHYGRRRFSYNDNLVGNILGTTNYADGDVTGGLPNIGNSSSNGTASAIGGDRHLHMSSTGGIDGTLTTRTSDTAGVITMTTLVAADITNPNQLNSDYNAVGLTWGNKITGRRNFTVSSVSGSTFSISGGSGTNLPAESTAVKVWMGSSGYQELDSDVDGTLVEKGNYIVSGAGGSTSSTGGDTVPNSYVYNSKPTWFRSLSWPPYDGASPVFDKYRIPASYRYLNGTDPAAEGASSTLTATTLNVTTINKVP